MQRKSTTKRFKSEAEEADWFASPAGKRAVVRPLTKAIQDGKVSVSEKRTIDEADKAAMRNGTVILYRKGLNMKPTDPAVLQDLMDRVKAKQTQAVSLRIPVSDINAAKKIAAQTGLVYQTVLKEIISQALRKV
jgi:hypothetical protein